MARQARGEYLNPDEIQVVHAVQRCVRQAFLCGLDKNSGERKGPQPIVFGTVAWLKLRY